jgi:hypothetical protein
MNMNINMSPLLVPQNMPIGQMRPGPHGHGHSDSPDPNLTPMPNHSPRTPVPHPHPHGQGQGLRRQFSGNHMMSPTSDPFNPVCPRDQRVGGS